MYANVIFQNFVAFGSHISIDLKVNIDGGSDYIYVRRTFPEGFELDMTEFGLTAKAAFLELCVILDQKGLDLLAKSIRKESALRLDGEYDTCDFAGMIDFIYTLNLQPYNVEMKAPGFGGSL